MDTIQITKEKLNLFVVVAKHYVNTMQSKKSALWVACNALLELGLKKLKKIEREKDLVRMKFCKKTASKHIEFDKKGNYQFTEEDNIKVLTEFDRIDAELVEFPTMIVPKGEYPQLGLSWDIRNGFNGIVLDPNEYNINDPDLKKMLEEENVRVSAEEEEAEAEEKDEV